MLRAAGEALGSGGALEPLLRRACGVCGRALGGSSGSGAAALHTSSGAAAAAAAATVSAAGAPLAPSSTRRRRGGSGGDSGGGSGRSDGGGAAALSPLEAALASPEGAARLCSPRAGDVADALSRAPALRLLQAHFNISAPRLRGQAVLARVVRAGGPGGAGGAVLDPGYYGLSVLPKAALGGAAAYTKRGSPRAAGAGPGGLRPRRGDLLRVRLGALFTPYGDVALEPVRVAPDVRRKLVWRELEGRMSRGSPVWGRVLNPCAGGYAVGVAGYVALLPSRQASIQNIQAIGALQQFYVHRMDARRKRVELSNYADGGGGGGAGGGGGLGVSGGGSGGGGGAPGGSEGADPALWSNL
jgi:hypothetical protein